MTKVWWISFGVAFIHLDQNLTVNDELSSLTNNQQEEISCIEENAKNKSTAQQTKYYLNKFVDFLKVWNYLVILLRCLFLTCKVTWDYSSLSTRKENGNAYSTSTYCCMRAAIHRFLFETRDMKLIENDEFVAFNWTYKAVWPTSLLKNKKYVSEGGSG